MIRRVKDPQPYEDPVSPPPGDPQQDRPLQDPQPPGTDVPRLSEALSRWSRAISSCSGFIWPHDGKCVLGIVGQLLHPVSCDV